MSQPTPVRVIVDNKIRIMAAALAATSYPQDQQDKKRHHAHVHARDMMKYLHEKSMQTHPAIVSLQSMLDNNTPVEALFTLVMLMELPNLTIAELPSWVPKGFNTQLWDFYQKAELAKFWARDRHQKAWDAAQTQSENAFREVHFKAVLEPFVGDIPEDFVFMPNLLYPADHEVGIRVHNQLISIVPPPLAWGESPPWPYDEDTRLGEHTYPAALSQYARMLMLAYLRENADVVSEATSKELPVNDHLKALYPTWEAQFIALFMSAVVAIYLEDYISATEARGYMLMERKVRNMSILPGTVSVLRRFLQEKGNRYNTLAEFLKVFPIQLKVARKIVTL